MFTMFAASVAVLSPGGSDDQSLPPVLGTPTEEATLQRVSDVEPEFSLPVFGVSRDGVAPTPIPETPEPITREDTEPTPTPASLPSTSPDAVACDLTCILRTVGWPEYEIPWALRVIPCESGGNPNARNPSGASGLWQIMLPLHQARFLPGENWADPYANSRVALVLYHESGHAPWYSSRHCWGY